MKKTLILDNGSIAQKTRRMAYQIVEENYEEKEIIMIGLLEEGHVYARMLKKEIETISKVCVHLHSMSIDKAKPLSRPIVLEPAHFDYSEKTVLLVDDVANTGKTLFYALRPLLGFSPKKVMTAVLVDRQHKIFPVLIDFVGLSLSTTMQEHIGVEFGKEGNAQAYLM